MTDNDAYLIGTDGWHEKDTLSEVMEIALFGWLNFDESDMIAPSTTYAWSPF